MSPPSMKQQATATMTPAKMRGSSTFHTSASCSSNDEDAMMIPLFPAEAVFYNFTKGANQGNSGMVIDWRDKRTLRVQIALGKIVSVRLSSIKPIVPREKPKKDPWRVSRPTGTTETAASVKTSAQNPCCCDNSSTSSNKDGGGFPKLEQKIRILAGVHKGKVGVFGKTKNQEHLLDTSSTAAILWFTRSALAEW